MLTDAVVDENMSKEQSEQVLGSILNDINNLLKERMNVSDKDVYLVRMPKIALTKPLIKWRVQAIRSLFVLLLRET